MTSGADDYVPRDTSPPIHNADIVDGTWRCLVPGCGAGGSSENYFELCRQALAHYLQPEREAS